MGTSAIPNSNSYNYNFGDSTSQKKVDKAQENTNSVQNSPPNQQTQNITGNQPVNTDSTTKLKSADTAPKIVTFNNVSASSKSANTYSTTPVNNAFPHQYKQDSNEAFKNLKNNISVMSPEMKNLVKRIEKDIKSGDFINYNDLTNLQKLANNQLSQAGSSIDNKLKTSLEEIGNLSGRMMRNLDQQNILYGRLDKSLNQIDQAAAKMRAEIAKLPDSDPNKKVLQNLLDLYEKSKNPATKVLMSKFMTDVLNTLPDWNKALDNIDKFCGTDENGKFKPGSVMGRIRDAQKRGGDDKLSELNQIMSQYDPDNAAIYRVLLFKNSDNTATGSDGLNALSRVRVNPGSSDTRTDGIGIASSDGSNGVTRPGGATNTSEATNDVTRPSGTTNTNGTFQDEDIDALETTAVELKAGITRIAKDPELSQRSAEAFAQTGILTTLQTIVNTEIKSSIDTLRTDCKQIVNLQQEMVQMTSQLQNIFKETKNDESGSSDIDMRKRSNNLIAEAEKLEMALDLSVENGDDITHLLKRFREIITTLDLDLRDNARKVNEKSFISNSNQAYIRDMKLRLESLDKMKSEINEVHIDIQQNRANTDNQQFQLIDI